MNSLSLLQRRPECTVKPVLEVKVTLPGHHVREEVSVEGGVLFQYRFQVENAPGCHQLVKPHLLRSDSSPLPVGEPVLGVGTLFAHAFEDHPFSLVQTPTAGFVPSVRGLDGAPTRPPDYQEILIPYMCLS